ncbi:uncharacterized protein F4822DRAFT_432823 [Hypoxylon trugodes]|uniref:uncharacterized protein n=1 Tax=Hypoxylon trugodes TaxID=326681 RepID=UPI00219AA524|nr:uncharacterized protein F4822DRAFT_432823 [Hypoxylon trugodes]KAI1385964.1 hypothetical protein F4822DRAFT_432823 [Hypoxylon trugodes]
MSSDNSESDSSDGRLSYYMDGGAEAVTERIKQFFDNNTRWKWSSMLGIGATGIVYRVQYQRGNLSRDLAVKIVPQDVDLGGYKSYDEDDPIVPDEVEEIVNEKRWLQVLRGNSHIVTPLDVPHDPFDSANTPPGVLPHRMGNWVFMEYLPNGPLWLFISRYHKLYPDEPIPNRLLWRFFMCLARMCLEMAYYNATWPDGRKVNLETDDYEQLRNIPPGPLVHSDIGSNNIMIGTLAPNLQNPEHTLSPVLKLIDFALAQNLPDTDFLGSNAAQINVRDAGEVMLNLIRQQEHGGTEKTRVTIAGQTFETFAGGLVDRWKDYKKAGVDPGLVELICTCLAEEPHRRLSPVDLAIVIRLSWDKDYPNNPRETDAVIQERLRAAIFDADTEEE